MFHKNRVWFVAPVDSAEVLAEKLTQHTWTLCTGFRLGDYLFLNDSINEDGAGEWGVVREKDMTQVESITFGWMDAPKALDYVQRVLRGEFTTAYASVGPGRIDNGPGHECHLCR